MPKPKKEEDEQIQEKEPKVQIPVEPDFDQIAVQTYITLKGMDEKIDELLNIAREE